VASASGRDAFNVYKLLQALATLGILIKAQVTREFSFAMTDDIAADASQAWDETELIPTPAFDLDETTAAAQPTLEMPNISFDADETAALSSPLSAPLASRSAWDDDDEPAEEIGTPFEAEPQPAVTSRMPAWDAPLPTSVAPIPAAIEPPADAEEEQWGFDEAQLETARAAAPPPLPPPVYGTKTRNEPMRGATVKSGGGKRTGLLLALLLLLILGAGGYAGWIWWQGRQGDAGPQVAEQRPVTPPVVQGDAAVATAATTSAGSATGNATATNSAAAQPRTITGTAPVAGGLKPAAPPTATATTATTTVAQQQPGAVQPLPAVVPRNGGATRLDQMAREYAANPEGNFTVQVQILCDPTNVEKAMKQGGASVWFVPQTIKGRSCYRIFYGRYATREEASKAMGIVPAALRDPNAAVKPVPR
jgi:hypothetical protein